MKHNITYTCNNVLIRQVETEDLELLRKWRNNDKNSRYLSRISYITKEKQLEWYRDYLLENDIIMFAIDEIDSINAIVGSMSLYNFSQNAAEFGRLLIGDERAHGKKVGLNAITALKIVAFEKLNLNVLKLTVAKENHKALHIYLQAGFFIQEEVVIDSVVNYKMTCRK
jgi:diamine N-acetyltransferase